MAVLLVPRMNRQQAHINQGNAIQTTITKSRSSFPVIGPSTQNPLQSSDKAIHNLLIIAFVR